MKKVHLLLTVFILTVCCHTLFAQSVSKAEADLVASRFVSEKYIGMAKAPASVVFQETISDDEGVYLYRYDIDKVGFVFVSASKATPAVLAYSLDEDFEMIPPVRDLFHLYKQEIRFAEKENLLMAALKSARGNDVIDLLLKKADMVDHQRLLTYQG